MIPFLLLPLVVSGPGWVLVPFLGGGASHKPMGLIRKNDSVLAGATKADRDSNGGYSHVSQGPRYRVRR
jgi:hypothetical protein